jgi:hypothetical protein
MLFIQVAEALLRGSWIVVEEADEESAADLGHGEHACKLAAEMAVMQCIEKGLFE